MVRHPFLSLLCITSSLLCSLNARAEWSEQFAWAPPFASFDGANGVEGTTKDFWIDGNYLYVVGDFSYVDGVFASRIAKWDGAAWSPVGNPVFENSFYSTIVLNAIRHAFSRRIVLLK